MPFNYILPAKCPTYLNVQRTKINYVFYSQFAKYSMKHLGM